MNEGRMREVFCFILFMSLLSLLIHLAFIKHHHHLSLLGGSNRSNRSPFLSKSVDSYSHDFKNPSLLSYRTHSTMVSPSCEDQAEQMKGKREEMKSRSK